MSYLGQKSASGIGLRSRRGRMQQMWQRPMRYFGFLQNETQKPASWRPVTLQAPVLCPFIITSLAIIITLEVLSHRSSSGGNGGGLVFARDVDSIPTAVTFGYLYLPTILAVCYSMMWSWVDLDVKRLEPWFQLSNTNGATAHDSLLLKYPFDFLPFIPLTAFRRKHWGVFFAGTIMLMVFWIITPLQSAIFNTRTVERSIVAGVTTNAALAPVSDQTRVLNANFLNIAYGISWLGQKLPAFTKSDFALLPYQPVEPSQQLPTETWSAAVDAFSTNLTCSPAEVFMKQNSYTFNNGKGCVVSQIALPDTQTADFMVTYIGYFSDPHADWALQNPNCSIEFSNSFLAIWASATSRVDRGLYNNFTALFCETSYVSQKMQVEVNATSHEVQKYALENRKASVELQDIFNVTNFEYLLGTGVSPGSQRVNLPDMTVLEQYPRLLNYSLTQPVSNMVGFAIGLSPFPVADLAEPMKLQGAFQKAHQILFTSAFSALTTETAPYDKRDGLILDRPGAIAIVRPISIIVEVAMGIIMGLTLALWYYSSQRQCNLVSDPASIADVISLTNNDIDLMAEFKDDGTLTEEDLEHRVSEHRFHLQVDGDGFPTIRTNMAFAVGSTMATRASLVRSGTQTIFKPVRPMELRLPVGTSLVVLLIISLAALLSLSIISARNNGIPLPSKNPIVLSILENYLPTAFATLLEPVWVILNRLLCLLQPFDELRKGNAKAASSVKAKYTSLPPQLVLWRALRSGHFLLAAVCTIAVSINLLAVALSGLLNESLATVIIPMATSQKFMRQLNGTAIFNGTLKAVPVGNHYDHFYVALSNLSDGTPLPSWIDEEFFYLPFDLSLLPPEAGSGTPLDFKEFRGTTTGFGANSTCVELNSNQGPNTIRFEPYPDGTKANLTASYDLPNGTTVTCFAHTWNRLFNETVQFTGGFFSSNRSSLEVVKNLTPATDQDDGEFCGSILLAGWARVGSNLTDAPAVANTSETLGRTLDYSFLSCTQQLRIATFEISVDEQGRVLAANRTSPDVEDTTSYFTENAKESDLFRQVNDLLAPPAIDGTKWHADNVTTDWFNSLLRLAIKSDFLIDPTLPVPKFVDTAPLVQTMVTQLFSILMSLNTQIFMTSDTPLKVNGGAVVVESRIFVSSVMFLFSFIILALNVIVAVWYYTHRPKQFLPRMPTSIASIMAFVSASRALEDFSYSDRKDDVGEETVYGYGRFVGTDGKTHVGIEQQRFVVPLQSKNPAVKRRRWRWRVLKEDDRQPRTWI